MALEEGGLQEAGLREAEPRHWWLQQRQWLSKRLSISTVRHKEDSVSLMVAPFIAPLVPCTPFTRLHSASLNRAFQHKQHIIKLKDSTLRTLIKVRHTADLFDFESHWLENISGERRHCSLPAAVWRDR